MKRYAFIVLAVSTLFTIGGVMYFFKPQDESPGLKILIYGPAIFDKNITHPDHKLLHEAFLAVAREHRNEGKRRFFVYEDFPFSIRIASRRVSFIRRERHHDSRGEFRESKM